MKPDVMTWEQYANAWEQYANAWEQYANAWEQYANTLETDCHLFEMKIAQLEDEQDALVRWQNKAVDRLIMWLEGKDEIDFIVHAERLLRELCNCENELPPCSICYRIAKATRKEIEGDENETI
jgi:hypothetical protein